MVLGTNRLKYLDLTYYLANGTSLSKFYAVYKVTSPKGSLPYEFFSNVFKIKSKDTNLPQQTPQMRAMVDRGENVSSDPYFSVLRQTMISNEDVDLCEKV